MNRKKESRKEYINFIFGSSEFFSSDENAKSYLEDEGYNVENLISDGLDKINNIKFQVTLRKTQEEQAKKEAFEEEASRLIDELLNNSNLTIPQIIKQQELTISYRKIQTMDKNEIRAALIKQFTLKLLDKQDRNGL